MTYNLISEPWIPIRRTNGQADRIRPHEIVDPTVAAIEAPRPDHQDNLLTFLIGLVQAAYAPKDEDAWFDLAETQPAPADLEKAFAPWAPYFSLAGIGPRFMQDATAKESTNASNILELLMETPTGQTLRFNRDLFVKRREGFLCWPCTAASLYVLQANAPEGGKGHMVSIRGGGPLTTLVQGPSLWSTLWANVLSLEGVRALPGLTNHQPDKVLPWLGPPIPGGKGGRPTTPQDGSALMAYWATPRRIWLDEPQEDTTPCAVCGDVGTDGFRGYVTAPNGFQYDTSSWLHPLAAYREEKGQKYPIRTPDRGMTYRDWLGLVIRDEEGHVEPGAVVRHFEHRRLPFLEGGEYRVHAFGFRTKQNAVLAWQSAAFPLRRLPEDRLRGFEERVAELVRCAKEMASQLEYATKSALFRRPGDLTGDMSYVTSAYWAATNEAFYDVQERLHMSAGTEDTLDAMEAWHQALVAAGQHLFRRYAMSVPFSQVDPQRISTAWNRMNNQFYSAKVRKIMQLQPKKKTVEPLLEEDMEMNA